MGWQFYATAIGAPLGIMGPGFVSLVRRRIQEDEKASFAEEFRSQFLAWGNSLGKDQAAFNWLIRNSSQMQNEMGGYGIYGSFKPPFANYVYNNYPIILNMIPELRQHFDRRDGFSRLEDQTIDSYGKSVDEAILRYIGASELKAKQNLREIRNPIVWLRVGVRSIISIPLLLLSSLGLLGSRTLGMMQGSVIFRLLTGVISLAGLAASVVTVLVGWDQTVKLVEPALARTGIVTSPTPVAPPAAPEPLASTPSTSAAADSPARTCSGSFQSVASPGMIRRHSLTPTGQAPRSVWRTLRCTPATAKNRFYA